VRWLGAGPRRGRAEAERVAAPLEGASARGDAGATAETGYGPSLPCLMCGGDRALGWGLPHVVGPCVWCFDGPYPSTADGRRLAVALAERGSW